MTMFSREDWELFRSLSTLAQKAGVSRDRLGAVVAKELVDNALDAVEGCADAEVRIGLLEEDTFYVEDSGAGIDPASLAELFSIRRPLTTSKLLRLPTRGALGNGLRVVAGAVLASGGALMVSTRGETIQLIPQDTGETIAVPIGTYGGGIGTRVEVRLGADLLNSRSLDLAERALALRHGDTYKGKTSPHWYDSDAFFELARAAGTLYARELIAKFDGCTGTKAGVIAEGFQGRTCNSITREEAAELLLRARNEARPVKAARLGGIGEWIGMTYASSEHKHVFTAGRGGVNCEVPMIIEVWVKPFAVASFEVSINKTPSTVDAWSRYEKQKLLLAADKWKIGEYSSNTAYRVMLNIQTPYMPITDDGKSPDLSALARVIDSTVGKAIRKAKRGKTLNQAETRVTLKDVMFARIPLYADRASSNGHYRFSQRQLFYAMRPMLMDHFGKEPSYDTFAGYITEYEANEGDIPGMYRDPRGTIYHPHTGEEIPLGTLAIEDYRRPEWMFNKVLYSEKEGLFAILKAERWAERHDCLLLTSKGQANRAAKDLIDLLGDGEEELTFFCIHDADAAGTMIYQSLQGATRARAGRRVKVINLGLEPQEADKMGLQVENTDYKKRQPVAEYVHPFWANWLQKHRVELNAMDSATFIRWLDDKFEATGLGKVKPPREVLSSHFVDQVTDKMRAQVQERILRNANIDQQVRAALDNISAQLRKAERSLDLHISNGFQQHPDTNWREVVGQVAADIVGVNVE
jgi:hypothetical protein